MDTAVNMNCLDAYELTRYLDEKVAKFFGANSISNVIVEDKYFIDLVKTLVRLDPNKLDYSPPCRQTLMKTTLPTVLSDLEQRKKSLFQKTDSVILTDGWKNSSNNSKLLVFTLRNKNAHQIYLTYNDTSGEPQDGDHVSDHMVEAVKLAKIKYNTNVFSINTDNDKTMKAAVRKANIKLLRENVLSDGLWETTCYSHSGNLLLGDIITDDFKTKLREIVTAFSTPKMCLLILRYGGCKLKNYPDTRFCFVRLTCECILKSWNAMTTIVEQGTEIVPVNVKNYIQSDDFHRQVLRTVYLITPICKLINYCQNPETNLADGTEKWMSLKLNTDEYDELIAARIVEAVWPVGFAANLMHHTYRGLRLDADQNHVALQFLKENLNHEGLQELTSFLESRSTLNRENLPDKVAENFTDAYAYWSFQEFKYPSLAKVVKKIMLIPASTASLESYFSVWTHVHNKYRNRLTNENGAILVDLSYLSKHLDGDFWEDAPKKRRVSYLEEYEYW